MSKRFIGIVAATRREFFAITDYVNRTYRAYAVDGPDSILLEFDNVSIVVRKLQMMGNLDSQAFTRKLIRDYHPVCIIGVGVCAGVNPNEQALGDVVLGTRIVYYEPKKLLPNERQWRPQLFVSSIQRDFLDRIDVPARDSFLDTLPHDIAEAARRGSIRLASQIHEGPYASGESVVADGDVVDDLIALSFRKGADYVPRAIDMESAGIAKACQEFETKFFIVKAISDFASIDKNDEHQRLAATVSFDTAVTWASSLSESEVESLYVPSATPDSSKDPLARMVHAANLSGAMLPARRFSHGIREAVVGDLVTRYDELSEQFLASYLHSPNSVFLGEEGTAHFPERLDPDKEYVIVDPLDGTQNLVLGRPDVAISIARYRGESPDLGLVHMPFRNIVVTFDRMKRVEVNGLGWNRPSSESELGNSVVGLPGDLKKVAARQAPVIPIFSAVLDRAKVVRVTGAAAYDLAALALGEIDARISTSVTPFDIAAGAVLVEYCGGKISELDGSPWTLRSKTLVAAANYDLWRELIDLIAPIWRAIREKAGGEPN